MELENDQYMEEIISLDDIKDHEWEDIQTITRKLLTIGECGGCPVKCAVQAFFMRLFGDSSMLSQSANSSAEDVQ